MSGRLTQPMRQVLRNLADGKKPDHGLTVTDLRPSTTVLGALRKRGLVTIKADATFEITATGRQALEDVSKHQ